MQKKQTLMSYLHNDRFLYTTSSLQEGTLLKIKDRNKKVGHLHYRIDKGEVSLYTFFIEPMYRQKGIGRDVLLAILGYFIGRRYYTVVIHPFPSSMTFYDKVLKSSPFSYHMSLNDDGYSTLKVYRELKSQL